MSHSQVPARTPRREQRRGDRHRVVYEVAYRVRVGSEWVHSGRGRTLNMSSAGVLFRAEEDLPSGCQAELKISWPATLDGRLPLTLVAVGQITRSDGETAAVAIQNREFRVRVLQDLAVPKQVM